MLGTALTMWASANGQANRFEIGSEGGPSLISLRGNDSLEDFNAPAVGYSAAIAFQYNVSQLVSLRTSLAYERKGALLKINATDISGNPIVDMKAHLNFDYLILPILVRLNLGNKLKLFVNAGPYLGYLIRQTSVTEAFNEFPSSSTDQTEYFKKFDIGLTGGLGCGLPIKNNFILTIEVRHNLGLYNTSELPVVNEGKILTNSTNLLFGLAYRIGSKSHEE